MLRLEAREHEQSQKNKKLEEKVEALTKQLKELSVKKGSGSGSGKK